ncbi:MAG: hypothetical protein COA63_013975 [Methylophaga sp.]|nr:hypothetical protein [Methylophaga sp.]
MALIFDKTEQTTNKSTANGDAPQATGWLNIGFNIEFKNELGEKEVVFVSLPKGIPLDVQVLSKISSKSSEKMQLINTNRNFLINKLQEAFEKLEAGDNTVISGLELQLHKVGGTTTEVNEALVSDVLQNVKFG